MWACDIRWPVAYYMLKRRHVLSRLAHSFICIDHQVTRPRYSFIIRVRFFCKAKNVSTLRCEELYLITHLKKKFKPISAKFAVFWAFWRKNIDFSEKANFRLKVTIIRGGYCFQQREFSNHNSLCPINTVLASTIWAKFYFAFVLLWHSTMKLVCTTFAQYCKFVSSLIIFPSFFINGNLQASKQYHQRS